MVNIIVFKTNSVTSYIYLEDIFHILQGSRVLSNPVKRMPTLTIKTDCDAINQNITYIGDDSMLKVMSSFINEIIVIDYRRWRTSKE